jgi:hypothetical protein
MKRTLPFVLVALLVTLFIGPIYAQVASNPYCGHLSEGRLSASVRVGCRDAGADIDYLPSGSKP